MILSTNPPKLFSTSFELIVQDKITTSNLDELDERIFNRNFPSVPLEPNYDPRPISTKYGYFPGLSGRKHIPTSKNVYPKYNVHAKYSCYALIVFTILATLLYHFPTDPSQRINFMKNVFRLFGFIFLLISAYLHLLS